MQTKFNEVRYTTDNPDEALGMYLAKQLKRHWTESFFDAETGKKVSVKRTDILMERGTKIDYSTAASIKFHIQCGDITEFEVTDQCREGVYDRGNTAAPWVVTACVKDNNRKFILYAKGVEQALEIAKDYIELKFPGHFEFVAVKGFKDCIAISDNFNRGGAENDTSLPTDDGKEDTDSEATQGKFYFLNLHVKPNKGPEYDSNFLVFTSDAEKAKLLANVWIADRRAEMVGMGQIDSEEDAFSTTIKTATTVNCYCVIPPDFTREYFEQEKATAKEQDNE